MRWIGMLLCLSSCAAQATPVTRPAAPQAEPAPTTQGGEIADIPQMAALRPPGADDAVAPLETAPGDPAALRHAAAFYAATDAPGMTLIYGLTYGASGVDEPERAELARTMTTVLRERVVMSVDGRAYHLSVRLAPGSMPLLAVTDETYFTSVAHLFEQRMMEALPAYHGGEWHLSDVAAVIASLAEVPTDRGPIPVRAIETPVTVLGWLRALAAAGHLDAFASWLFGLAFEEEYATYAAAHGPDIAAMRAYVMAHPLVPTVVRAWQLVQLR